jgi:hypothetical protein
VYYLRVVDKNTLNRLTDKAVEKAISDGTEVSDEYRQLLLSTIWNQLAPFSLVEEHTATIMHHYGSGLTFISGSSTARKRGISTFRSLFSSIDHKKHDSKSLKERLSFMLEGHVYGYENQELSFGDFSLTGNLTIKASGPEGGVITLKDVGIPRGEDIHGLMSLPNGKVERIGLQYKDLYSFILKPNFEFSAIQSAVDDDLMDDYAGNDDPMTLQNPVEIYCEEAAVTMTLYVDVLLSTARLLHISEPDMPDLAVLKTRADLDAESAPHSQEKAA